MDQIPLNVMGADLSLTSSGFAVLDISNGQLIESGSIRTKPTKTNVEELERLRKISSTLLIKAVTRDVRLVVIEGLAFMARNTSALVQLSALNYMLRNALYEQKIPFVIVAPTTLKKFVTLKGNGPKDVIMLEVYKRWGVSLLDNNEADSYGLAQIGRALIVPDKIKLVKEQKEVIKLLQSQWINPV